MSESPTIDDILRDIEFEIIQGALGRDDLGQALQAARRFHAQSRHELLSTDPRKRGRELAVRQFQINEMLLVLIQETASRIRKLQIELHKVAGLVPEAQPGIHQAETETASGATGEATADDLFHWSPDTTSYPTEVERGDRKLEVQAHVQPVRLPLVGPLLTRLRTALHSLPVFYVNQFASQQREVNRALGDSLAELSRHLAQQEAQIQALDQQLHALQTGSDLERASDR